MNLSEPPVRRNLLTIALGRPFLAVLAEGLLRLTGGDPLRLPRVTVLLPTRRAVRALREAFLRVTVEGREPGAPLLLPRMQPVGDLDLGELLPVGETAGGEGLEVPPAIPELRRRLLLAQLVMRWGAQPGRDPLLPGQAAALAASLARLLDKVASEGASFDRLGDLVPAELAEHWQMVSKFLEVLPRHWPGILAEEGALDPAERRNRLLERQAALWRRLPPPDLVVAAGLTGGIPALTGLIATVAALDRGMIVLAGLDRGCDRQEWSAIEADEAHPQHLLARLLRDLDVDRAEVRDWPERRPDQAAPGRAGLLREVLRPAATTDAWQNLPQFGADALAGLSRYDCANVQHEAVTIALLLRRKLETPGATAALVTADRGLARRVAAELRRWDIDIDDSAGLPLARTPPGAFLRLVLGLAESGLAPVPLLAALKHPLTAGGLAPAAFRELTRELEKAIRGPRPAPGVAGLREALGSGQWRLLRFVDRLESCLGALPDLLGADRVALARLTEAHVEAAERLAASDAEAGGQRLWCDAAGETAASFCHELIDAARDLPPLAGRHYPAVLEALVADVVVRPVYGRHPRLAIWGLLEARLQQADLVVLGGLNEGSWPGAPEEDPWMSRQMRRDFAIAVPERAIGIAAHDFAQAAGAPEVALTRAVRSEGVPTTPSRWLLRLDAVLRAVGVEDRLRPDETVSAAVGLIDEPGAYRPLPSPEPRPPLSARPRRLSVTQVETWLRDPYAIYARHILRLKAADELDADPSRADLGIAIHKVLDEFIRRFPRDLPEDAEQVLLGIGRAHFEAELSRPGAWAFWWPRFERVARWLVALEIGRGGDVVERLSECKGSLLLEMPGGRFELTAAADRIDRLAAGGFLLIDYKTGGVPEKKQIEAGFAPQLPLEGAILREGAFGGLIGGAAALEYWRLKGGDPAGERTDIGNGDAAALIEGALARLRTLIARFDDPATPYYAVPAPQWKPRFSDYRHLERNDEEEAEEWARTAPG
ncbi:MAG: double-strand break repair protein AddB [Stellaceae bacterium]